VTRCLFCGCTDAQACPNGCSWVLEDPRRRLGVCSSCDQVKVAAGGSYRFNTSVFIELGPVSLEIPEAHARRLLIGLTRILPQTAQRVKKRAAKKGKRR
jgi:hypothetical protein